MALEKQYHAELQMELQGMQYSSSVSDMNKQISGGDEEVKEESAPAMEQNTNDNDDMSMLGMSRRQRGLYEAMKVNSADCYMLLSTSSLLSKTLYFFVICYWGT